MRYFFSVMVLTLGTFAALSSASAQQASGGARLRMEAAPTKIYAGESFRLSIDLDNIEPNTPPPSMEYLAPEFDVEYLGPQSRSSSRVTIINGVTQRQEDRGVTFLYRLTPKNTGQLQIEPPTISIVGRTLSAPAVSVEVIPPNEQNLVRLELSCDKTRIYPLTPFAITLSVFVRGLPGELERVDPIRWLSREVGPPALSIPWADDERLSPELIPHRSLSDWLRSYLSDNGGFSINGIRAAGLLDFRWGFGDREPNFLTFLPVPARQEISDTEGKLSTWIRYDFTRHFTAEKTGPLHFDAATIKGTFAEQTADGKLAAQPVYTLSQPLEVTICDVPVAGRPDHYLGAFGTFDLRVALQPRTPRVGEAMTLTLALTGKGSVLNVKSPPLQEKPEIASMFKLYPPTEETTEGGVQWTWSLRPLVAGAVTFPSITISYFDVAQEKFVTLESEPIRIDVEASPVSDGSRPSLARVEGISPERSAAGIFGNRPVPNGRLSSPLTPRRWGIAVGSIWGIALFLGLTVRFLRRRTDSPGAKLKRHIEEAHHLLDTTLCRNESADRNESLTMWRTIQTAFCLPIADRFGVSFDALTGGMIGEFLDTLATTLRERNLPGAETVRDTTELMEQIERFQYGAMAETMPSKANVSELFHRWVRLLTRLGAKWIPSLRALPLATSRRGRSGISLGLFGLIAATGLGCLPTTGCSTPDENAARDRFFQAIREFDDAATTPEPSATEKDFDERTRTKFRHVAARYEGLLRDGIVSGPILFNQGNAFFHAGDPAHALAAWRRAEAFLPRNPYLKANIESVLPTLSTDRRPWIEMIFFWQRMISTPAKGWIALVFTVIGASGLFLLTAKCLGHHRRKGGTITVLAAFGFLLFATSYLYDVHRFSPNRHVIFSTESFVRKGASERYEPLYRAPLPALTEGKIVARGNGWLEVQFADGQRGWIPESSAVVW